MPSVVDQAIQLSQAAESEIILQLEAASGNLVGASTWHYHGLTQQLLVQRETVALKHVLAKLYPIICDPETRVPKPWLEKWFSGDLKEIATVILGLLIGHIHVPTGVAVPLAALLIKNGVGWFCQLDLAKPSKPKGKAKSKTQRRRKKH